MSREQLTHAAMASLIGMNVNTFRSRLTGRNRWSIEDLDALAALGVELPELGSLDAPHQPAEDEERERAAARATRARRVGQTRRAR